MAFGKRDQITDVLNAFIRQAGDDLQLNKAKRAIKVFLENHPEHVHALTKYVPTRFIRPFTGQRLVGMPDPQVDNAVREMSKEYRYREKFPYSFAANDQSIVFNPHWLHFLQTHFSILQNWASWHWVRYMQKVNPSVPAIPSKLHPIEKRQPIDKAIRKCWVRFVNDKRLICVFSNKRIVPGGIHLDHFLPWSFVAHDEMWNLVPIDPQANSSKSDRIPDMEIYLEPFVDAQSRFLAYLHDNLGERAFGKRAESYILGLGTDPAALLKPSALLSAYESQMKPLAALALNQGFRPYP